LRSTVGPGRSPLRRPREPILSWQALTLNIPYEWQKADTTVPWEVEGLWVVQVALTMFFVVIVLGQLASSMFKRKEIAEERMQRVDRTKRNHS
jgi:hypothetical protein